MSAISLKSISGITSITTPAGVDNQFTLHNNNTTEAVKLDTAGNFHFHNHVNTTGISTASNFKTGTSNLHSTGLNIFDLDVDGHTNLDNVSIAGVTTAAGNITISSSHPKLLLTDDSNPDFSVHVNDSAFHIRNETVNRNDFRITSDGTNELYYGGNKKFETTNTGANVTGNFGASGNISLSGSFIMPDSLLHANDNTTRIRFPAPGTFSVDTSGNERLRITSAGLVGIGTDIPHHLLDVTGNAAIGPIQIAGNPGPNTGIATVRGHFVNAVGDFARLYFSNSQSSGGTVGANAYISGKRDGISGSNWSAGLAFHTDSRNPHSNSPIERMVIGSTGNVGIASAIPAQRLDVDGIIRGSSYFQGGASSTASNNWHFGAEGNGEFRIYTGNYGAGDLKQKISSNGDVLPGANNTSDLGSGSLRWRNVYTTDLQLSNEGKTNDVDGTWGNYTIQEGESDLFLINNRNGKKYVFLLKEVS